MNCSYCGRETKNPPERIENSKRWACNRVKCQREIYAEENKAKEAADRYDDWVTRIP